MAERLHQEIVKILRSPEVGKILKSEGADPVGNTPSEFAVQLRAETERWGKVVQQTKMRGD